jgi:PII-like signaling protein
MSLSGERVLLRVYLESADRAPHTPTHERIVRAARNQRLAGATVLKGILGFGSHGLIRKAASMWSIVEHVPVIVEIVDSAQRIWVFVNETLGRLMIHGMATLERAHVMTYRHRRTEGRPHLELGGPHVPLSTIPQIQAREPMQIKEEGVLLRVFIGESDKHQHKPR